MECDTCHSIFMKRNQRTSIIINGNINLWDVVHYTKLKSNYIPQIDIAIYDDAGALIPFHKDAVTSITLHFRMKS